MFFSEVLAILRTNFLQNTSGNYILTIMIIFWKNFYWRSFFFRIANLSYISSFAAAKCVKYYSFFKQLKIVHGTARHGVLGTTVRSTTEQYAEMVSSFERKNTVCVGIMMCKGTVMSVVSPQLTWKLAISCAQVTAIIDTMWKHPHSSWLTRINMHSVNIALCGGINIDYIVTTFVCLFAIANLILGNLVLIWLYQPN